MKKNKQNLISIILTLLVIGIYLIPNFVSAFQIDLNKLEFEKTDKIIFSIKYLDVGEKINTIILIVDNTTICNKCSFTELQNYYFGYGYGYGYGYGTSNNDFETDLEYKFSNLNVGEHKYKIILNSKFEKEGKFKIKDLGNFIYNNTKNVTIQTKIIPDINITVKINPNEVYYYSKLEIKNTKVYVMPSESNVKIENVVYSEEKLKLDIEGNGTKEINFYLGDLAKPNKVFVDNNEITNFDFINSILFFNISLSKHSITLDWSIPSVSFGEVSGGGKGSHYYSNTIFVDLNNYSKRLVIVKEGNVLRIKKSNKEIVEFDINTVNEEGVNIEYPDYFILTFKEKETYFDMWSNINIEINKISGKYAWLYLSEWKGTISSSGGGVGETTIPKEEEKKIPETTEKVFQSKVVIGILIIIFILLVGLLFYHFYLRKKKKKEGDEK